MITLGVDTSGKTLSVAVLNGDVLIAELFLSTGYKHGVTLQPAIEYVLGKADLMVKDVDLFAVAIGPGSFTGIRIGLSSVKAMAYAVGSQAVGISSLHALARSTVHDIRPVFAMFDARGGRVFGGLFRGDEQVLGGEPQSIALWVKSIKRYLAPDEVVTMTGDGVDVLQEAIECEGLKLPFEVVYAPFYQRVVRASVVAQLAINKIESGHATTDPFLLDAYYGLLSSAERANLERQS
ncbi:MAG TPA: tRNA (adenosine(37)-N6)-threonylcarbamoyltransferase complex dimerization subunit type 1 TsaB [Clostridiaceae bacterium]|nr:tRNA (adenosine(37)-N6)-threonylcarbamoyltransferase complex dimerization subunit type 1 TsaB [Clostridiaceae bacterium]